MRAPAPLDALPEGFGVATDPGARRHRGGRVLAGGAPLRVVRLSSVGSASLRSLEQGAHVSRAGRELGARLVAAGLAAPIPGPRVPHPTVQVVIPTRDRPAQLERCLRSLGEDVEVLVVDDGSRERAAVAAACARHRARLIVRERPGGPAAARNASLSELNAEVVAFLDDDCVAPAEWLELLGAHFADPTVAAVAPRVCARASGPSWRGRYFAARCPLDLGVRAARVGRDSPVGHLPAAALLVRRGALGPGFAEELRLGEDVDLLWRLEDAGWTVRYDPRVAVWHEQPASWLALLARRHAYGRSAGPLARRHPGRLAAVALAPAPALATALALSGRPLRATAVAVAIPARHARELRRAGMPLARVPGIGVGLSLKTLLALARALCTVGAPLLLAGLLARRTRRAALLAVAAHLLAERRASRTGLDPLRFGLACIADDVAYGAGVWRGCVRARTGRPLCPRLVRRSRPTRTERSHT